MFLLLLILRGEATYCCVYILKYFSPDNFELILVKLSWHHHGTKIHKIETEISIFLMDVGNFYKKETPLLEATSLETILDSGKFLNFKQFNF
jgi:hypothetical protein